MFDAPFVGFTKDTVKFFRELEKNNTKEWFDAHRETYDEDVVEPSRAFVVDMGAKLKKIAPGVIADPRTNRSLFRLQRDTRFSKDKSPYKTHFGLILWEGEGPRMECSCFYLHFELPNLFVGVGVYQFSDAMLDKYRRAAADPVAGKGLTKAVATVTKSGAYALGGQKYQRVPRGFDPNHPNADLLKHGGLYAGVSLPVPPEFYSADLMDWCFRHYKAVLPLHKWLVEMTRSA